MKIDDIKVTKDEAQAFYNEIVKERDQIANLVESMLANGAIIIDEFLLTKLNALRMATKSNTAFWLYYYITKKEEKIHHATNT